MDLNKFQELWDYFLAFLDRSFQWLMYIFVDREEDEDGSGWPPADFPDINA